MADEVVGSAYVVIRAITSKIRDDIREGVKKGATGARGDLEDAGETIGDTVGSAAGERAGQRTSQGIQDRLRDDRGRFRAAGRGIGDRISDGIKRSSLGKVGQTIGRAISRVPLLPFILAMLVPALGGAMKIIAAFVGGATSLLASLGPAITGSVITGIGAYTALFQAMGAVRLAFSQQTKDLKKFMGVWEDVQERFGDIGVNIQRVLLEPLAEAMNHLSIVLFDELNKGLVGTGRVLAFLATQAADFFDNPIFQRSFGQVLQNNNRFLGQAGTGLTALASALTIVLSAARPVLDVFGQFIKRMGLTADESAKAGKRTGALADFFDRAAESMKQWGRIIGNVFGGIANILQIAAPFGQILTNRIERLTQRFQNFTESADGENKIALFFKNSLPIIRQFTGLIGDVFALLFGGLAKPGAAKGTVDFLKSVRQDFLPALASMAGELGRLGPHLVDLGVAFAGVIESLAESGALGSFVTTLSTIFDTVSKILALPLVGELAGWALAFAGVGKAIDLVLKPIGGLTTILRPAMAAIGALFGGGGAGAGGAAAGAGFAAALGPILAVVAAIAALAALVIYLWKTNEKFRNIVRGAWADIQKAVEAFLSYFTDQVWPQLKGIFDQLTQAWEDLTTGTEGQLETIRAVFSNFIDYIVDVFDIGWQVIAGLVEGAWTIIKGVITGSLQVISGIIDVVMGVIKGDWGQAWDGIVKILKGIWTAVWAILRGAGKIIWTILKGAWDLVVATAKLSWNNLVAVIVGIGPKIWEAVKKIPGLIMKVDSLFLQAGRWLMDAFLDGLAGLASGAGSIVGDIAANVWDAVKSVLNSAIDKINAALTFHISIPGPDIGFTANIPHLATGGRASRGTLAVIGEGKEPETVLPDSLLRGLIERANETGRNQERAQVPRGTGTVIQLNVNNPVAERTSESLMKEMSMLAQMGLIERVEV